LLRSCRSMGGCGSAHDSSSSLFASSGPLRLRPRELYPRLRPLDLKVLALERVYGMMGAGEVGDGMFSSSARSGDLESRPKSLRRCWLCGRDWASGRDDLSERSDERCWLKCDARFGVESSSSLLSGIIVAGKKVRAMTRENKHVVPVELYPSRDAAVKPFQIHTILGPFFILQ
jgi:hypothetical protein